MVVAFAKNTTVIFSLGVFIVKTNEASQKTGLQCKREGLEPVTDKERREKQG